MMSYSTRSAAETIALGRALSSQLRPGDVVAFYGDLGAGKTTMIKGICDWLGVRELVKSPSFVVVTEYRGRIPVYHVDLYRLDEASNYDEVGLDAYLTGEGVCLIEWAERAEAWLPETAVRVRISLEGRGRRVEVSGLRGPLQPAE
jgi:tRNA threonylcarbamoyladenosine biosynthesis protein TsaE